MKFYDVSLEITEGMVVYPGDPEPRIEQVKTIPESRTNNSRLTLGSHTGTHVDSKKHVSNKGAGVDRISPDTLHGRCTVLDLTSCKEKITAADLKKFGTKIRQRSIILLKTKNSQKSYKAFRKNFIYLSEDGADYLVKKKVKTMGVDYLSVQQFHAPTFYVHKKIISNMTLFEGLNLSKVKPGSYVFIGLPLKIKGCDGAPARVILVKP